jgi:hypothetical protein
MVFRVVFGVAFVWLILPHEPDIGFGRPGPVGNHSAAEIVGTLKSLFASATGRSPLFAAACDAGRPAAIASEPTKKNRAIASRMSCQVRDGHDGQARPGCQPVRT